ncbi:MAG: universal stress protein [Dyadobacter fermentans]
MKNILVPFDFSALAMHALGFAADIAAASGGQVVALYVLNVAPVFGANLDSHGYGSNTAAMRADPGREAAARFEKVRQQLKGSIRPGFRVERGLLHQAILRAIHETEADLVVMGTKGSSGLAELLVGSNTEKVIRTAPVPVITVHKALTVSSIRNIIIPTAADSGQQHLVRQIKALQAFFGAHLHVLYVKTPDEKESDKAWTDILESYAAAHQLSDYSTHVTHAPTEEKGVLKFSKRIPDSMIAMGTHGYTGITHLMLGSVAENVVNHTREAVWTYRLPGARS